MLERVALPDERGNEVASGKQRRTVERELNDGGLRTLGKAALAADNRRAWKERACSSTLHWEHMEENDD